MTYDVYRTYFNPEATGAQIKFVSRVTVLITGLVMGCFACILNAFGSASFLPS
jgi:Na+/proline symporter